MSKVRIYDLAKQLNKNCKEILDELTRIGVEGKTHSSSIDPEVAEKVRQCFSASINAAEKAPAVSATAKERPAAPPVQPKAEEALTKIRKEAPVHADKTVREPLPAVPEKSLETEGKSQ